MDSCRNCKGEVHTPDERTGLIHTDGRYACFATVKVQDSDKVREVRLETVAE